ncbi:MAG: hypothetical protein Q4A24_08200 [Akkermansia sp.]|nr:hypothetical protein [Akkermansia sp.]
MLIFPTLSIRKAAYPSLAALAASALLNSCTDSAPQHETNEPALFTPDKQRSQSAKKASSHKRKISTPTTPRESQLIPGRARLDPQTGELIQPGSEPHSQPDSPKPAIEDQIELGEVDPDCVRHCPSLHLRKRTC